MHFPLALLLTATLADLAGLAGVWRDPQFAARLMAAGLAAGVLAMIAGMLDLRRLDEQQTDRIRHRERPEMPGRVLRRVLVLAEH